MKDKKQVLFVVLLILLILLPLLLTINPIVQADADSAIQIDSIEDLWNIRNNLSGYYILMRDLDFQDDASYDNTIHKSGNTTGSGWLPIGSENYEFTGTFDGQNNIISNFFIDRDDDIGIGFFGYSLNSTIININLIDVDVTGYEFAGGLIGFNMGNISNCSITGSLYGFYNVGGLVGYNLEGSILDSYAAVNVHGENCVGGLVGSNIDSFVDNSHANRDITGLTDYDNNMGGLIGYNNCTITNCYASGDVVSEGKYSWYIGGLVGENDEGSITNCYSTGYVDGSDVVGGLIGGNTGIVENCFWDEQTSGQDYSDGGTGITTSEMKNFNTFIDAGWDIAKIEDYIDETWFINHIFDYPHLGWESTSPINNPPNIPYNPTPSNGKTSVNINQDLYWNGGDPDGDLVTYDVYIGTTSSPIKISTNQISNNFDPGTMNYNTKYFWKIVSWDNSGSSSIGPVWSFTTGAQSQGGGGGTILYPNIVPIANASASAKSGLFNTPITFNASYSFDEDGEITNYKWDFGDDSIGFGITITHVYVKAGIYNVKLIVTDDNGATDTDFFNVIISQPSNVPTIPQITGQNTGKKNIEYGFSVFSTDTDNDTIKYVFDWGDGQTEETDFLANGTTHIQKHKWFIAGIFKIEVYAIDDKYSVSNSVNFSILIDIIYCGDFGYLIDKNCDGTYDLFYSNQTQTQTSTQKQGNSSYLLNYDEDSDWDYIYDMQSNTFSSYLEPLTEISNGIFNWLIVIIVVIFFLVTIVFIIKRKKQKEELGSLKIKEPQIIESVIEEQKIQEPKIEVLKTGDLGVKQSEVVISKIEKPISEEPQLEEPKTVEQKVEELLSKKAMVEEPKDEPKIEELKHGEKEIEKPEVKKLEELKTEELKVEKLKIEEVKTEEQKAEEQKIEELKTENLGDKQPEAVVSKIEEPITGKPQLEELKTVEQKVEELITVKAQIEASKSEEPYVAEIKTEEQKIEELKTKEPEVKEFEPEESKVEEKEIEEPKIEELKTEETKVEEKQTEEQKVGESKTEEPHAQEPKTDEEKTEEQKAQEAKAKKANDEESKD